MLITTIQTKKKTTTNNRIAVIMTIKTHKYENYTFHIDIK